MIERGAVTALCAGMQAVAVYMAAWLIYCVVFAGLYWPDKK